MTKFIINKITIHFIIAEDDPGPTWLQGRSNFRNCLVRTTHASSKPRLHQHLDTLQQLHLATSATALSHVWMLAGRGGTDIMAFEKLAKSRPMG